MALFAYFAILALFVVLFTREVIAPASGASCDKRWRIFAGVVNGLNVAAVLFAGWLFADWIKANSIFALKDRFDPLTNSALTFLTASFITYWWHRFCHASDTLWRSIHQLHHSPSRIEVLTAFYIHPFDSLSASLLNALTAFLLLGVSGEAAALSILYVGVFNLFAHADMRTPYWLGYFTQRPEMHRLHHERGKHENNYGLPIWDMLFGTWRNPSHGVTECGFDPENEFRIREMLMLRKVQD